MRVLLASCQQCLAWLYLIIMLANQFAYGPNIGVNILKVCTKQVRSYLNVRELLPFSDNRYGIVVSVPSDCFALKFSSVIWVRVLFAVYGTS